MSRKVRETAPIRCLFSPQFAIVGLVSIAVGNAMPVRHAVFVQRLINHIAIFRQRIGQHLRNQFPAEDTAIMLSASGRPFREFGDFSLLEFNPFVIRIAFKAI